MISRVAVAAVVLAAGIGASADESVARTRYLRTASGHVEVCAEGGCESIPPNATEAIVRVEDQVWSNVQFDWFLTDAVGGVVATGRACNQTGTVAIPSSAVRVFVRFADPGDASVGSCPAPHLHTTGIIETSYR